MFLYKKHAYIFLFITGYMNIIQFKANTIMLNLNYVIDLDKINIHNMYYIYIKFISYLLQKKFEIIL